MVASSFIAQSVSAFEEGAARQPRSGTPRQQGSTSRASRTQGGMTHASRSLDALDGKVKVSDCNARPQGYRQAPCGRRSGARPPPGALPRGLKAPRAPIPGGTPGMQTRHWGGNQASARGGAKDSVCAWRWARGRRATGANNCVQVVYGDFTRNDCHVHDCDRCEPRNVEPDCSNCRVVGSLRRRSLEPDGSSHR